MFIRKDEYERLCNKIRNLENELHIAKKMFSVSQSNKRKCDSMCKGCKHHIELKEIFCSENSLIGIREYTVNRCALDRECKDYKAEEK